ncbi:hypothetical protein PVAP13_9KG462481 [Panicum virgatum]|uniref:Uncharacterized protein n=1 Tax=Panicum virgatum TaxID=38727 RepID=A0A8T0NFN0_PANVG|nr:hypothetical protein PVAP13_9KG462481 [Panicum virgatum]
MNRRESWARQRGVIRQKRAGGLCWGEGRKGGDWIPPRISTPPIRGRGRGFVAREWDSGGGGGGGGGGSDNISSPPRCPALPCCKGEQERSSSNSDARLGD